MSGVKVRVLTTDTAGLRFADRLDIKSFPTRLPAGYDVYYCGRLFGADVSPGLFVRLWKMIRWADVVHLTAAYSSPTIPTLLICKLQQKPVVWSPRGALQRWNTTTRRGAKGLWERICNSLCEPERVVLHVTSDEEKGESLERITRATAEVIQNGIDIPTTNGHQTASPEQGVRLLYLGRLHPIKGVENLLTAMSCLDSSFKLSICGDGDQEYRKSLEQLVKKLGMEQKVAFHGFVQGEAKERQFHQADVCVVPSFKENFCVVVAESLAHGVPVIASRGTPWNRLEDVGCGVWVNNDSDSLAESIRKMNHMPLKVMGERGRAWMSKEFSWDTQAEKMLSCYKRLYENSIQPQSSAGL